MSEYGPGPVQGPWKAKERNASPTSRLSTALNASFDPGAGPAGPVGSSAGERRASSWAGGRPLGTVGAPSSSRRPYLPPPSIERGSEGVGQGQDQRRDKKTYMNTYQFSDALGIVFHPDDGSGTSPNPLLQSRILGPWVGEWAEVTDLVRFVGSQSRAESGPLSSGCRRDKGLSEGWKEGRLRVRVRRCNGEAAGREGVQAERRAEGATLALTLALASQTQGGRVLFGFQSKIRNAGVLAGGLGGGGSRHY
ncbi:hypothetical protein TREES_T100009860 [Tupaia chinensis]|uniref:Uncharacterized protein n=1 Tax=Tupaia chinensis TaxID=246437 RepID=L9KQZ7_TUPCH|nr:hypothetical protein TREES_T100009860 [Tupaia chinensis]